MLMGMGRDLILGSGGGNVLRSGCRFLLLLFFFFFFFGLNAGGSANIVLVYCLAV